MQLQLLYEASKHKVQQKYPSRDRASYKLSHNGKRRGSGGCFRVLATRHPSSCWRRGGEKVILDHLLTLILNILSHRKI